MEFTHYDHQRQRERLRQSFCFSPACRQEGLDTQYLEHCMRTTKKKSMLIQALVQVVLQLQRTYTVHRLQRLEYKVQVFQRRLYGALESRALTTKKKRCISNVR